MGSRLGVIAAIVVALLVGALPAASALPPVDDDRTGVELEDLPEAEAAKGVDGGKNGQLEELTTSAVEDPTEYEPQAVAAPEGGTATENLAGLAPGDLVRVGEGATELPVEVGAPEGATAEEAAALEGDWQVDLHDQDDITEAAAIEVAGVALTVTPPAEATGDAVIALDYTDFSELYGADWADRLEFVQYPECFLETPDVEGCSEPTEVPTDNVVEQTGTDSDGNPVLERRILATVDTDVLADGGTASASTTEPASSSGEGTVTDAVYRTPTATSGSTATQAADTGSKPHVLLATDSGSGSKGDFSATPLVAAGSWSAGGNSGAFTYSYPLQTPTVPGGPSPNVTFSYNSQVVDGRTSATNNQASWIGDGWEYNAGSISRTYKSCRDDATDGNNASRKTSDLCWGSDNAVLTLGGTTTELVKSDQTGEWVAANGDGSRVELLKNTGLGNGDNDGEHWRVTTRDGTQYFFGRHKLPGWTDGNPTTNSVLTVPVAGNQSGEPCYATEFKNSFCAQAWRWNLDYVVDVHGNAMTLWWDRESNHYAKNNGYKEPISYHRGGYLKKIDYGLRTGALFAAPISRVTFDVAERCFKKDGDCTEANFTSGNFDQNRIWYDTPADLHCAAAKECYVPVPTFWSRKRLSQVTTWAQRTEGSTDLTRVDRWGLQQSLPADRTDEGTALWLESITRTGYTPDGETTKKLNPVRFVANTSSMPNRVVRGANDPNPKFDRLRITRVVSEYGGETVVTYKTPDCRTNGAFPKPESNKKPCFPVYWHPDPDKETIDWFHKYVVKSVQELPALKGVPSVITEYEYPENGAAWAKNQAEFSKKKTRTYDQWRGYALVTTYTGDDSSTAYMSTEKGMTKTRYFRGMHGDPLPGGATRSVTVTDAAGNDIAVDREPFAGRVAETLTYTSAEADTWLTRTVDKPKAVKLASRAREGGIPALKAWRVLTPDSLSYNRISDSGTVRTLRTITEYEDTYGLPVKVESKGDTAKSNDDTCTVMSYVHNTGKHLIGLDKQTLTTAGTCAAAATASAGDWISGSRVAYDGGAYGDTPATGLATTTWDISGNGGGWTKNGTIGYDTIGRVTSTTDALGHEDTTAYSPSTGQVYEVVTANALGHSESTVIEPGRGTALRERDPNGHTTGYAYDPLGRTKSAWGNASRTTSAEPAVRFTYNTVLGQPVSVVSRVLKDDGSYDMSTVIYDGLGRERQKQDPAVGGGRLVTDVLYSANGTIAQTNNAYFQTGEPSKTLFELASEFQVANATLYAYDGLGRVLSETPYLAGVEKPGKATRYEYGYDNSTVIAPEGAASQRSYTDALGRVVRVDTFTNAARTESGALSTTYRYDERGDQVGAEDSEGNVWSWAYDARGRQVSATDPDTGTTKTAYDVLNRPVTVEDARGVKVWTGYDELSRPVEQRLNGSAGEPLTKTVYDTLIGGVGLPASTTRFTDGLAYTTEVTGYTAGYQPLGRRVKLPESVAMSYGLQAVYSYGYSYSRMGLLQSMRLPGVGTLPEEEVVVRYNEDGLPITTSGADWYTAQTSYSPYGEVLRTASGEQPHRVWTTNLFDETTGELTQSIVDRESVSDTTAVTGHRVSRRSYTYDLAGNVTSVADRVDGVTDRQCFTYDALGQLTEAWTASAGACAAVGKTVAAPSYADGTVNVTAAGAGYWQSYTYDALGNRTKLVEHDPGLDASKDATTAYSYGASDGSQPHTLTGMSHTSATEAGAQVTTASTAGYDAAGQTTARSADGDEQALSWTWDGQVETVTGFGENGAGAWVGPGGKCLDLNKADTTPGTPVQLFACNGSKAQKFRIDPVAGSSDPSTGALKILGMCVVPSGGATADGTPVTIADCTGEAGQRWTATAEGTLKHVASGRCLAVPGSGTADSTGLQLAACTGGERQSWVPDTQTRYVYDGTGARLMAVSASERTLYLGEATIAVNAAGAPAYTERYYSQPGAPTVMRHTNATGTPELSVQVADHNGTAYANVTLAPGNKVKFSKTDPFGNERTEHTNWRSHRSYVGGDDDTAHGLVHLGAREYDPATGRFLSADPLLDLTDLLSLNGYAYANNSPLTYSDASGLKPIITADGNDDQYLRDNDASWTGGSSGGWTFHDRDTATVTKGSVRTTTTIIRSIGGGINRTSITTSAEKFQCTSQKHSSGCSWQPTTQVDPEALHRSLDTLGFTPGLGAAADVGNALAYATEGNWSEAGWSLIALIPAAGDFIAATRKGKGLITWLFGKGASTCKKNDNSFPPGTLVLMADGTTKPIEDIRNGDHILATDPETGETSTETVTAEITGNGTKHLVKITISTSSDNGKSKETAEVTATDGHPFWVPELDEWIDATNLTTGQWLQTGTGTHVQITAIRRWTSQATTVHNLTISDHHTYYVLAGQTPVLVHNCGGRVKSADWHHIFNRHSASSRHPGKSKFMTDNTSTIRSQVEEALKYGTRKPNGLKGGHLHEYDFGKTVGYDRNGKSLTGVRVVVRGKSIVTAFPIKMGSDAP
ncbi:ricin-type beta-trefoil lectin domain protein [Streptomyces sp. NPDC002845]